MIGPAARVTARPDRRTVVGIGGIFAAAVVGVAIVTGPMGAMAAVLALGTTALVLAGPRIPSIFQFTLGVLLIGYLFLGRGFAYVGVGAAYVGELGVALAIVATIASLGRVRLGITEGLLLVFMAWGALRTIPYLGQYGPLAFRDAVTWGYAAIALGVAATLSPRVLQSAVGVYRRVAFIAVIWFPIAAVLTIVLGNRVPSAPGSTVPFVYFKAGDTGVHLAGIAAFVLVGLYSKGAVREALLWVGWGASTAIAAALNRGGMVAASTAVFALLFVRRLNHWLVLIAVAVVLLVGAWLVDPRVDLGLQRNVSFQQMVDNLTSIFVDQPNTSQQGTKEWRLEWWGSIVKYTVDGPYFWTGKGYGINLADSDGFQVNADRSLRAPHSAHFEILARSGVPGLLLWIALQAAWVARMLTAAARARRTGRTWWLAVTAWLFVYWLAAMVNMSVDVYLGGPQGGIWFWAVSGAGLAVSRMITDDEPEPAEDGVSRRSVVLSSQSPVT